MPHEGLARRPATAIVAAAAGPALPAYLLRDQVRAIVNAAATTTHRLLIETLWQSGGRASEVLRLRPCDVDRAEGALRLTNLKQRRRALRQKLVYVGADLVAQLLALARDARLSQTDFYFGSTRSAGRPMSRQHLDRLIKRYARSARVYVESAGRLDLPSALHFRHGSAVHQLRAGVPLSEVQQQLGHARIDTTTIYTKLTDTERRSYADRVAW